MARSMKLGTPMTRLLVALVVTLAAAPTLSAEFTLRAGPTTVTMPDGAVIPMWGFACESAVPPATCPSPGVVTVPGPRLAVPAGDTTLTVNLTNALPVPISIVVPGQRSTLTPVWTDGTSGPRTSPDQRVRSFTQEAAPGGTARYVWNELRPGTFLYHSGTHPQVQVQMGLYGAVTLPAGAGLAYAGVAYDLEHLLLFSEIDPVLHDAVAGPAPTYGTAAYPSTLDYRPKYFLVNGAPFTPERACLDGQVAGDRVLLRMLNAGLRELAPMVLESHWSVVAEGGSPYRITSGGTGAPHGKEQYSVLLPPAGTGDVIFAPASQGAYRIIDRRLNLTNALVPDGGFQTCLAVAPTPPNKHAGDLDWASANVTTTQWRAVTTVTVHDAQHAPLAGVVVSGSYSAGGTIRGCTTATDGQCKLTSNVLSRATTASVSFTLTGLTGTGAAYLSTQNHDPDTGAQASDGTHLTIPRP
jgi:FtsP/CotA-like multicopper oxidase with cupredoxin domain